MIPASTDEPMVTFTRFARDWFRLLARGGFADAASRIDEPNSYGERWSAEKIQAIAPRLRSLQSPVRVADPDPNSCAMTFASLVRIC